MKKTLIVLAALLSVVNLGCSKLGFPGRTVNKSDEGQEAIPSLPPPLPGPVRRFNAKCPSCGHLMVISRGYMNERVLCNRCRSQISARQAMALFGSLD